jgi:PE family
VSFLIAAPQLIADAAANLTSLGSTIGSANSAAMAATAGVLPAAADEVSAEIASLFSAHAAGYQQLSAQAAAFHEQFVELLGAGGSAYVSAEAQVVQTLAGAVPALGVDLGGGLSGLEAGVNAEISGLGGSLSAALNGGFGANLSGLGSLGGVLSGGLPGLTQTCGSLVTNVGGGLSGLGSGWSGLSGGLSGLGGAWSGLSGGLGGGLSGMTAVWPGLGASVSALGGAWSNLSGSLGAMLSGSLGLSGLAQTGGSMLAQLGGIAGLSPGLGASISAGLSGLGAQFNLALSGGLSAGLSGIPNLLGGGFGSFQALLTAGSPAGFLAQLQAMETGFNSALINGEFGFNTSLVAQELAIETALFGGPGALNGALDDVFNFWNGVLGTGEISFDSLLGAQFSGLVGFGPGFAWSNPWYQFVSGLYVPGSFAIGNNGWINGLVGALDNKFLWDLDVIGWVAGALPGGGQVQSLLQIPIGALDGLAAPQVYALGGVDGTIGGGLNGMFTAFNTSMVNSEMSWESGLFGANAFGGALDRTFNVGNLFMATGQQTVSSLLGAAPFPPLSSATAGSSSLVFNGGNIGGLEGIFDQTLAAGFDLAGLL